MADGFNPSRRTFLKGMALGGIGAATSSLLATQHVQHAYAAESNGADSIGEAGGRPFTTYESDVLVVGGGLAGMCAARNVLKHGKTCTLVDKGPFGHSGASGINWGHHTTSYEGFTDEQLEQTLENWVYFTEGMVNQEFLKGNVWASRDLKLNELMAEIGCILERDPENGQIVSMPKGSEGNVDGLFPRMLAQYIRRSNTRVIDRTMIIDILQADDGSAAGAIGINLVTGDAVVFRAKSIVMATGSAVWTNGWSGVGAKTDGSPECTADGMAILLSHEVPFSNLEFFWPYSYNVHPSGNAFGNTIGFFALDHPDHIFNSEGEFFIPKSQLWQEHPGYWSMWKLCMKEILEGRGTELGGLWWEISQIEDPGYIMRFNRTWKQNFKKGLNWEIGDTIDLAFTVFDSWAMPQKVDETGSTIIPGLYWTTPHCGAVTFATAGGHLCGGSAADYAGSTDLKGVSWTTVQEVLDSAYHALENDNSGKRANEVQHEIQALCNAYLYTGRSEENCKAAIAELNRIKEEDMPNMQVTYKTRTFNWEWRQALEVPFMWTYAMAKANAIAARKETRASHIRTDMPNMDNGSYLKDVVVTVKDGQFNTSLENLVDTYVSTADIQANLYEAGIGTYPQA